MSGTNELPRQLRSEAFTIASVTAGCSHCQSHGAYSLHLVGDSPDLIRDIWSCEQSNDLAAAEMAAMRLARDAALVPSAVEPAHFVVLRKNYPDRQIVSCSCEGSKFGRAKGSAWGRWRQHSAPLLIEVTERFIF